MAEANAAMRGLPSVDAVLGEPALSDLLARLPRAAVSEAVRAEIAEARRRLRNGGGPAAAGAAEFAESAAAALALASARSLRGVINATGVVLHTNLGRAPLGEAAMAAMAEVSRGYSTLEFELAGGTRGSRLQHVDWLLRTLTGAEASVVVNNNAAALYLALSAHAAGHEVIVSRGEAVEIGGGFRIPDVLRQSGARLVEVGTTNRTRAADFAAAAGDATAALLRVHSSNFRIVGFTESPSLAELRAVADETGVLLIDDVGSGCLLDAAEYGLAAEPKPQDSVAAGSDLVLFSGDKLLGGPQAGIIVGREASVAPLRRHPLLRALRCDKATLAGLAATLETYLGGRAVDEIPVWRMIAAPEAELEKRARAWRDATGFGEVVRSESAVGGGSLPGETLPTWCWSPEVADPNAAAAALRTGEVPVVARVQHDRLLLDPRTVLDGQDGDLTAAVRAACGEAP